MPDLAKDIKPKTPTQEQAEKAQKELDAQKAAQEAKPKIFMRTRYVYEVINQATLTPAFEISFFESDPDKVMKKAQLILLNNSANPDGLSLRLKYLEVIE